MNKQKISAMKRSAFLFIGGLIVMFLTAYISSGLLEGVTKSQKEQMKNVDAARNMMVVIP